MKIIMSFIIFVVINSSSFPQNWSTPIVVGSTNHSTSPVTDIAIDKNDLIHIVFQYDEDKNHKPDDIHYTFFNGTTWSTQSNISKTDTFSMFPDIKVDKENMLHVMWGEPEYPDFNDIFYTNKKNDVWSKNNLLYSSPKIPLQNDSVTLPIENIDFEFDSLNKVHLVWGELPGIKHGIIEDGSLSNIQWVTSLGFRQNFTICNDKIHLTFFAASPEHQTSIWYNSFHIDSIHIDTTLGPDGIIVRNGDGIKVRDPQVLVDSKNVIHIIWLEGTDPRSFTNDIYHSFSEDEGKTWSEAINISPTDGSSKYPGVVVDSINDLHVVWAQTLEENSLKTDHIEYVMFDGETWTEPETIFPSPVYGYPHLAIDSQDYLHTVYNWYSGEDGEQKVVYSSTNPAMTGIIDREKGKTPKSYRLFQNYPNPFNPSTTISFSLPSTEIVSLTIFNNNGEIIKRIITNALLNQGVYKVQWNGKNEKGEGVASGVYFYQLKTKKFTETKKTIFLL